jgi:D-amino-acid oxidase
MRITVVGAGVVGLSAAVELERAGHDVQVVAAATGDATTSAVAAALWFPYKVGPIARVAHWAQRSRIRLEAIARDAPDAGVDIIDALEVTDDDAPWWLAAIPDAVRVLADLPGRPRAWRYRAPRVEPARFLPWLEAQLARPIERRRVARLDDEPGDVVVCAAGLGARELAGDPTVTGVRGQVVIVETGVLDLSVSIDVDDPMFYAIPRRGEVVLGGCAIDSEDLAEDAALTARILADAHRLGLRPGAVRRVRTGLRPCRPEVRLERVGRIVHCYGHGGAGYTLALGCAEEIAQGLNSR